MCLYTDSKIPSIAEEDITCYKVYVLIDNQYVSPYQNTIMPSLGTIAVTELDEDYVVYKGFHSFISLSNAQKEAFILNNASKSICAAAVFKCVIPKNAKYYKGFYGLTIKTYCSNTIIVKELVCSFK